MVGRFRAVCLLMEAVATEGVGGMVAICLCSPLEKELTSSAEETQGANVKI